MVGLERLLARWFAFRTEVVLCTLCSVLLDAAKSFVYSHTDSTDFHRLSRAMLAPIRMVEKTLKASPLSNRRFERSEYPRHEPNRNVHLEKVPQQPVMNSNLLGHPFRVHMPTQKYPECTDVYSGLLSGDAFSVIYF